MDRALKEVEAIIRREKPRIPDMPRKPDLRAPKLPK
jgi:hypothetical protein